MSLIGRRRCDQSSRNLCLGSPVRQEVRVRRLGRATNSATAPCDRIPLADWVGGSSCLDARSAGSRFSARSVLLRLPVSTSLVQPLATAVAKGSTTIREAFEGLRRSGTATNDTAFANRRHRRAALFAAGNCQDTVGEPVRSGRNRWFVDSPLVGGVSSEPVSELGFFGARDLRPDSKTFVDDSGSVRGSFRTRIGRNLGFLYLGRPLLRCVLSY